jgi:L-asparaginase
MQRRAILSLVIATGLTLSLWGKEQKTNQKPHLPTVAIILTGGTILERTDPETGASVTGTSGEEIIEAILELKKLANLKVITFSNIDSSQMTPEIWTNLSKVVDEVLEDPDIIGAVVAHGTDTMAEAAFFLDLTLKTSKNVVFTGAMKNASDPYSEGPPNLINSVVQAFSPKARDWGVTINMNSYIHSAMWVKKAQTINPQAFLSGEKGLLGYVYANEVYRINDRLSRYKLPIPKKLPNIAIIYDYSGSDGTLLKAAVNQGVEGIVVEGFGSGNVDKGMFEAIQYALDKKVIVAITTHVFFGAVFPSYGDVGGGATLEQSGVLLTGSLGSGKVRLLLMLLIAEYGKDTKKIKEIMQTSLYNSL